MTYHWPLINESLERAVLRQLHRSLSDVDANGILGELERTICDYYEANHSIFFSSATAAMHSLYYALGLKPGENIVVPAYTFFASYSPFAYEGIEIRQADSDQLGNIDAESASTLVDENTRALIATHMWGVPADMDRLVELCDRCGIALVEDCSHAHLATYRGRKVGTFGAAGVFSTNQKTLTSGEGGFLITPSRKIFEGSICLAHYNKRIKAEVLDAKLRKMQLTGLGLKYRGFTLGAAILLEQFDQLERIRKQRFVNYTLLARAVKKSRALENITPEYDWTSGLYVFPFLMKSGERDELLAHCHSSGYSLFDAPGSTRVLDGQPLFLGDKEIFHRLVPPKKKCQLTNAPVFNSRMLKLPLWGYGDGSQPDVCAAEYASFIEEL